MLAFIDTWYETLKYSDLILFYEGVFQSEIEFEAKTIRILSHLKIFELKKVSHFKNKTRDYHIW